MTATSASVAESTPTLGSRRANGDVEPTTLRLGAWLAFKHRLPFRLRPICSAIEKYLYARRGLPVWVDNTLIRVAVDAAPSPSTSPDHVEEGQLMSRVLRSLRPGDVFLDVGSHVGLYALAAAQRVGETGRVKAFEPTPATVEKLARNVRLNGVSDRVEVHQVAMSDSEGSVEFVMTGTSMMNSIFSGTPPDQQRPMVPEQRITVRTAVLDTFLDSTRRTVAKIDTEGHEIPVLRGATALLKSSATIFIELHPWAWGGEAGDWDELQSLCADAGRSIRLLDGTILVQPAHRRAELVRL